MALVVWSSANAKVLNDVFGSAIAASKVAHKVVPNSTIIPQAGSGDVVLVCGTRNLELLQKNGLFPKNRTVTSLREKPVVYNGAQFLVTFDPSVTQKDYARLPEVQWDVQLAIRLHETGQLRPKIGIYRYVESLHELIEEIETRYAKTGRPVELSSDLETKSFNPYVASAWIIACSFTIDEGKSDVLYFERGETPVRPLLGKADDELTYWEALWLQLDWIFTSEKVSLRGANYKYDSNWMVLKWDIVCSNQKFDTMLVGSLLDENRSNSLKLHAKIMTPMGGYEDDMDKYDFACLEEVPKDEMLNYVGGDTDATYRVAVVMKNQLLKDKALSNFYVKLLQPAAKAFEKMERRGVLVDRGYYQQLQGELKDEIIQLQTRMLGLMPNKLRIKYKDSISLALEEDKSPFKAALLKEFLFSPAGLNLKPQVFTEKTKEPSTSMDHLMMFESDPVAKQFISAFRELGSASKTLSTFVVGFLKHLRPDGRFHPTYMLHRGDYGGDDSGTTTGRTSAKDPAIQTVPKHSKWAKRLRKAFIAPPGYVILQVDFSQGELRITACVADEPTMIDTYANNIDLHAVTAAQLNGYTYEDFMLLPDDVRDELRSGGKAGNFGLIYGMQHAGFRDYAYTTYGVVMTEEEAFLKREAFFALYNRLPQWHEDYKKKAKMWGMVRSPLGRIRHLPLITSPNREVVSQCERQAINSPIQSCLSDMMMLTIARVDQEYGEDVQTCMMCHDSMVAYVKEDAAEDWAKRVKCVAENLPLEKDFGWRPQLKFIADAEIGVENFAELKKLKHL